MDTYMAQLAESQTDCIKLRIYQSLALDNFPRNNLSFKVQTLLESKVPIYTYVITCNSMYTIKAITSSYINFATCSVLP